MIKILVSSANCVKDHFDETFGKSLIYRMKSKGPKMDHWGIPINMFIKDDCALLYRTLFSVAKLILYRIKGWATYTIYI